LLNIKIMERERDIYIETLKVERNNSTILNPASRTGMNAFFFDGGYIKGLILELEGSQGPEVKEKEKGKYFSGNTWRIAVIPYLEEELKKIEKRFEEYKKERVRQGYEAPEKMPPEMEAEYLKLSARLSVKKEELKYLKEELKKLQKPKDNTENKNVLKFGLRCSGQLQGGILKMIDGQNCDFVDGVLCIVDHRSPYNGMAVSDYRKLAAKWRVEKHEEEIKKLVRLQKEARERGEPVPLTLPVGVEEVPKEELPEWPEWAENHFRTKKILK